MTAASAVLVLLLRLVRTKVTAVLLGPAGVGLLGTLSTLLTTVQTASELGLRGSAIRQIAQASGTGDHQRMARVVATMRRVVVALGLLGAGMVCLFAAQLAQLSFGNADYTIAIVILSLAVLFTSVNNGQRALLRGMRRVEDLARSNVWSAFWATCVTVLIIWLWGIKGIAPSLVATAMFGVLVTWYYTRRVSLPAVRLGRDDFSAELRGMAGLGVVFLLVGGAATATQLAMRAILVRSGSLEIAGEFQAAATLSVIYAGFVMQAIAQDFYPRLTAVSSNPALVNRLTNEQIELALHLGGPGIVATTVLAEPLIRLLYSDQFVLAAAVLKWQCLGVLLRLVSVPIAYILMARGDAKAILATELCVSVLQVAFFWVLYDRIGLIGAALALPAAYAIYLLMLLVVVGRFTGYRMSGAAARVILAAGGGFFAVILAKALLAEPYAAPAGFVITVLLAVHAYRSLARMTNTPLAQKLLHIVGRLVRGDAR